MSEFAIKTTDNAFSNTFAHAVNIKFEPENNNRESNTQGFLRKSQKGTSRIKARVRTQMAQSLYEDTFIPMLVYPQNVQLTFDRNIPANGSPIGTFVFEDMKITKEFDEGNEYEVDLFFTEVLA